MEVHMYMYIQIFRYVTNLKAWQMSVEGSEALDSIVWEVERFELEQASEGVVLQILNVILAQVEAEEVDEEWEGEGR